MVKLLTESLTFFKATQTYLSEAFEMEDEYVRERPQAHLHHALLQLFTVGTFPGIVRIELELVREFNSCQIKIMWELIICTLSDHSVSLMAAQSHTSP